MGGVGWRAGLVFVVPWALYAGGVGHGFHYDDFHSIVHNPHLRSLDQAGAFFVDPTLFSANAQSAMYRPVLLLSYALNYAWGHEAAYFRLVNIALHALNGLLVGAWLARLSGRQDLAWTAALLFAVTPLNSEAVNYISSRSELLMATGVLAACAAYLRWRDGGGWIWYGLALGAAALALLSKAVGAVLPGLLVAGDLYRGGWERVRERWRAYAPFAVLVLGYVLIARQVVGKALGQPVRPWSEQAWTQIKAVPYYLQTAIMPVRLSVEHQFFVSRGWGEAPVVLGALLALCLGAWAALKGGRTVRLGLLWAGLAWLPTAVVPLYVLVNEHRLYLVSVAWALMVAAALGQPRLRRGVAIGGVGLYTILLACLGVQRTAVWADAATLWSDAAVKGPAMLKPQLRLADEWARQGQIDAAEAAYRRALALRPQHEAARNNLGRLYLQDRRWALAEAELRYLLAQYPDNVPGRLNLAKALIGQGDWQAAAACYKQVLAKEPTHGGALVALGHIALGANQDAAAALAYYDRALAVGQSGTDLLLSRGVALRGLGRLEEAAAAYRQVLEIDPKAGEAWFNLGNLLAAQGRRQEALGAYETAAKVAAGTPLGERAQGRLRTLLKEND